MIKPNKRRNPCRFQGAQQKCTYAIGTSTQAHRHTGTRLGAALWYTYQLWHSTTLLDQLYHAYARSVLPPPYLSTAHRKAAHVHLNTGEMLLENACVLQSEENDAGSVRPPLLHGLCLTITAGVHSSSTAQRCWTRLPGRNGCAAIGRTTTM